MVGGRRQLVIASLGMLTLLLGRALLASAQEIDYFGTNTVVFETVGNSLLSDARGRGIVDYQGGDEPKSQWRASFRFSGLDADTTYTVVVKGRFGDPGSDEATALSPLCSFDTDSDGSGSCFWFFRGLARLDVVQLLVGGDETGRRVMQASRAGTVGSITTTANRYSPGGVVSDRNKRSRP